MRAQLKALAVLGAVLLFGAASPALAQRQAICDPANPANCLRPNSDGSVSTKGGTGTQSAPDVVGGSQGAAAYQNPDNRLGFDEYGWNGTSWQAVLLDTSGRTVVVGTGLGGVVPVSNSGGYLSAYCAPTSSAPSYVAGAPSSISCDLTGGLRTRIEAGEDVTEGAQTDAAVQPSSPTTIGSASMVALLKGLALKLYNGLTQFGSGGVAVGQGSTGTPTNSATIQGLGAAGTPSGGVLSQQPVAGGYTGSVLTTTTLAANGTYNNGGTPLPAPAWATRAACSSYSNVAGAASAGLVLYKISGGNIGVLASTGSTAPAAGSWTDVNGPIRGPSTDTYYCSYQNGGTLQSNFTLELSFVSSP